jgi:DNA-nicking Smr family endonuclease
MRVEDLAIGSSGWFLKAVTSKKPLQGTFKELVGEVDALPQGPARHSFPPDESPAMVVRKPSGTTEIVVETYDDLVVGHAADVAPRLAHELAHLPPPAHRTVDLHRMSVAQATEALADAFRRARRDGVRCLLLVHGKGKHSGAVGPVLPEVVMSELTGRLASAVLAFRTAPPALGGNGAILVRLRAGPL